MMPIRIFMLWLILLTPQTVLSWTGNEFKEYADAFNSGKSDFKSGVFAGYVTGIRDVTKEVCMPANATNGQALAVVSKALEDYPEYWHLHPSEIVTFALVSAFPCRRK